MFNGAYDASDTPIVTRVSRLNDDVYRCRDADCPERDDCARWGQREIGYARIVVVSSVYPFSRDRRVLKCPYRIPVTS